MPNLNFSSFNSFLLHFIELNRVLNKTWGLNAVYLPDANCNDNLSWWNKKQKAVICFGTFIPFLWKIYEYYGQVNKVKINIFNVSISDLRALSHFVRIDWTFLFDNMIIFLFRFVHYPILNLNFFVLKKS